jgi:hypothetical protein
VLIIFTLGFPFSALAAKLLFDPINCPMAVFISQVPSRNCLFPLKAISGTPAIFAPVRQSVFRPAVSVKITLVFPLFAAGAQLLFETADYPVTVLISQILSNGLPVFPANLSLVRLSAAFAVKPQSVSAGTVFVKLTFLFPLLALRTAFVLHAIKRLMRFFIVVVSLCHSLLAPYSELSQYSRQLINSLLLLCVKDGQKEDNASVKYYEVEYRNRSTQQG